MIRNSHGRYMQSHELYPLLGIKPGAHLPKEGFEKSVQGFEFRCDPASGRGNQSPHRLKVLCPCGKYIPFGRMAQHEKGRDHKNNL